MYAFTKLIRLTKSSPFLIVQMAFMLAGGCARNRENQIPVVRLSDLPSLQSTRFKVDSYISAAGQLQRLARKTACRELLWLSRSQNFQDDQRILVLCRMLFTARPYQRFRTAMLGGPSFLGGTDYTDWPLEPIELVDGIPFAIHGGWALYGSPEPIEDYVRYCIVECDWNPIHFTSKTQNEKQAALAKLLSSRKWRRPLTSEEQEFFAAQIR